jgi:hypothetical protein
MNVRSSAGHVLMPTLVLFAVACSTPEGMVIPDVRPREHWTLLAASPMVGSLAIVDLRVATVSQVPIGVTGSVAEVETIGDRVFALVYDDSVTDSATNGVYELGPTYLGRRVLSSDGPHGRVDSIASHSGALIVLTERSVLELHNDDVRFRRLGSADPHSQGGGLRAFSGGIAYVSAKEQLCVLSLPTGTSAFSDPYPRDESRIFQFGILGVVDQSLLVLRPGSPVAVVGQNVTPRTDQAAIRLAELRAPSVKQIGEEVFVWDVEEYPRRETKVRVLDRWDETTALPGLLVSDVASVPSNRLGAGSRPPK